jgi:hypothetical protein
VSDVLAEFDAVAIRQIPPNPGILKAIGLNHRFESAIADLVDNSLDAGASRVLIRFVLRDGLARQLVVVDNGRGMNGESIDAALELGKPKADRPRALGYFGMGLKSASFSQASGLTVLSLQSGHQAEGRRMSREARGSGFEVEVLDSDQVAPAFNTPWVDFPLATGTIIRWDDIRTFPAASDPTVTSTFVESKVAELTHHLGLLYHRLLTRENLQVEIDVFDADAGESGFPFAVEPIDPFAYTRTGAPGYPKTLLARCATGPVEMLCHVWPAGSDSHFFKLFGAPVDRFQGFYLYRNDRLLSAGEWGGVAQESKRRRLARVAIDIDDHLDAFSMSVEKSGVRMVADLVRAIEQASADDGTSFADYLTVAEETFQQANRRIRRRSPMLPPGQGIPPRVKKAIEREVELIEGEEPLRIRWTRFESDDFLEVDRRDRTLWLNSEYRQAILKGTTAGVNDAPLLKALLFLLYEDIFRGSALGIKDKDNMSLWHEVLGAAAEEEVDAFPN